MGNMPNVVQLQREAADRVRQMEERSRRLVQEQPVHIYRGVTLAPLMERQAIAEPPAPAESPKPTPSKPAVCRPAGGLAGLFEGDNERLLLLLLAAVLAKNGAPIELMLALLYVAL